MEHRKTRPLTVFPGGRVGPHPVPAPTPEASEVDKALNTSEKLTKAVYTPPTPLKKINPPQLLPELASVRVLSAGIWTTYQKLSTEHWAGAEAMIANSAKGLVAIIQREANSIKRDKFKKLVSPNIVDLLEVYHVYNSIYFVYEYIDVTLLDITSGQGGLNEAQVAFVCKELLHGLGCIHDRLQMTHGSLEWKSLFVTSAGRVKIGNVPDCQLIGLEVGEKQRDYQALGSILISLLLPGVDHSEAREKLAQKFPDAERFYYKLLSEMKPTLLEDPFMTLAKDGCLIGPTLFASRYKLRDDRWLEA